MRRVLCALALAAFVVAGVPGPAFAEGLTIRKVDTTKFPTVAISVLAPGAPINLALTNNNGLNGPSVDDGALVTLNIADVPAGKIALQRSRE